DQSDRQRRESERVAPFTLLAVDRPERETADRERDNGGAEPVERTGRALVAALADVGDGHPQRDETQRHVHEKRHAPRQGIDERAADDRTEDGRRRRRAGPETERAALRLARERRGGERERARDPLRARRALQDAEGDEEFHRRRDAAQQAGHEESREAEGEHAPAPEEIVERAREPEE